jgi:hypothetical protein
VLSYEPLTLSVSNECDRIPQIVGGGVGLVSIRNHPRDKNTRKCQQTLLLEAAGALQEKEEPTLDEGGG